MNSWPARIGLPAPNFRSKILLIAGTNDEPPVMKKENLSYFFAANTFAAAAESEKSKIVAAGRSALKPAVATSMAM